MGKGPREREGREEREEVWKEGRVRGPRGGDVAVAEERRRLPIEGKV